MSGFSQSLSLHASIAPFTVFIKNIVPDDVNSMLHHRMSHYAVGPSSYTVNWMDVIFSSFAKGLGKSIQHVNSHSLRSNNTSNKISRLTTNLDLNACLTELSAMNVESCGSCVNSFQKIFTDIWNIFRKFLRFYRLDYLPLSSILWFCPRLTVLQCIRKEAVRRLIMEFAQC